MSVTDPTDHPAAQAAAKRRQIIQGAELVFTHDGYEGASMSKIAAEAGVSKGTLYNYFDSKSSLFRVFVEQKASVILAHVFDTTSDDIDPATTLRSMALRMVDMMISADTLMLYRIVVSEARKFPQLATVFWQSGPCRAVDYMTSWIKLQEAAGHLLVEDPRFAAEQFLALCQTRIAMQRRLQVIEAITSDDVTKVVEGAVRLFLAAYGVGALASVPAKS